MKTDECTLNGSRKDIEKALELVEKVAEYNGLSRKEMLQLRLLAEEILGMQADIMGFVKGTFYMENKERVYNIYFHTELDEIHQLQDKFGDLSQIEFIFFAGQTYYRYLLQRLNCKVLNFNGRHITFKIKELNHV